MYGFLSAIATGACQDTIGNLDIFLLSTHLRQGRLLKVLMSPAQICACISVAVSAMPHAYNRPMALGQMHPGMLKRCGSLVKERK